MILRIEFLLGDEILQVKRKFALLNGDELVKSRKIEKMSC